MTQKPTPCLSLLCSVRPAPTAEAGEIEARVLTPKASLFRPHNVRARIQEIKFTVPLSHTGATHKHSHVVILC